MTFEVLTQQSASEAGAAAIAKTRTALGFVPNLIGMLSAAPPAAEAYLAIASHFSQTSLAPVEQQVILLSASHENACDYCMAAHSTIAGMVQMPAPVLEALRSGKPIADARLEALRTVTRQVVSQRGRLSTEQIEAFEAAGFTSANLLEVILGVAMKTLSNYANHIASTPLDPAFRAKAWPAAA